MLYGNGTGNASTLVVCVVLYCNPLRDATQYNNIQRRNRNWYTMIFQLTHLRAYGIIVLKEIIMAYIDFPEGLEGQKNRKAFWLSEQGLALITHWRANGMAILDIATKNVGVSKTAWWGWYRESEALRKACADGKDVADANVEHALYRRAVGYDYWEESWELIEGEIRLARKFKKHMPPDTKAIMQWLFNRLPVTWRAQQEPLQDTQYAETIKNILVAMKEVAEDGQAKELEAKEDETE